MPDIARSRRDNFMHWLPAALFVSIWPAERVVLGMRVCKSYRQQLAMGVEVLLKGTESIEGGDIAEFVICKSLVTFAKSRIVLVWERKDFDSFSKLINGMSHALAAGVGDALSHLDLSGSPLDLVTSKILACTLTECKNLARLKFKRVSMGDEGDVHKQGLDLIDSLAGCTNLQHLDLSGHCLADPGVERLAGIIKRLTALTHLDLSCNSIEPQGASSLARALMQCTSLMQLHLESNNVFEQGAEVFLPVLQTCTALTHFCVAWNELDFGGIVKLSPALGVCKSLQYLDLAKNNICPMSAESLARGLGSCASLTFLDLRFNILLDAGMGSIAEIITQCSSLQHLALEENKMGDEGATKLAEGLARSVVLESLSLSRNQIGRRGAKALAEGMVGCTTMKRFAISHNHLGAEGAAALGEALKNWRGITVLDLGKNGIGDDGMLSVVEALRECGSSLQELGLKKNNISSKGVYALAKLLKQRQITKLVSLDLAYANLRWGALLRLMEGCNVSGRLERVKLKGNATHKERLEKFTAYTWLLVF